MFQKFSAFCKLYRADVLILSFLAFFAGRLLSKEQFDTFFLIESVFIALFPYNFVYTLNSITDIIEDSANKPWRPLPSGVVSRRDAVLWLLFITLCSISGTVILFEGWEKILVFSILVFGIFYSLPPFVLKKHAFIAQFFTGLGISYPMIIAGGISFLPFSASLLLHVWGVTALKDLSDFKGDCLAGRNVKKMPGIGKAYTLSTFLMIFSIAGFLMTQFKIAVIMPISSLFILFSNYCSRKKDFNETIYGKMIFTTGVSAVVALLIIFVRDFTNV